AIACRPHLRQCGIGLGLAVVRSIARSHDGDAVMINRPEGGLRARVMLPAGY
ncbi:MAG TPA: hypothetical protein PKB04_08510, partial [Phenylobacterium sp.]|nr:hypothetical protein [Phenylobacterium sp.]